MRLSEDGLDYHLIMAHPSPMDRIPNQRSIATILIQLILHGISLRRRLRGFLGHALPHLSNVKDLPSILNYFSLLASAHGSRRQGERLVVNLLS